MILPQPVLPWWEPPDPALFEPPGHHDLGHPGTFTGCSRWPCDSAHRQVGHLAERKAWAYRDFVRRWSVMP